MDKLIDVIKNFEDGISLLKDLEREYKKDPRGNTYWGDSVIKSISKNRYTPMINALSNFVKNAGLDNKDYKAITKKIDKFESEFKEYSGDEYIPDAGEGTIFMWRRYWGGGGGTINTDYKAVHNSIKKLIKACENFAKYARELVDTYSDGLDDKVRAFIEELRGILDNTKRLVNNIYNYVNTELRDLSDRYWSVKEISGHDVAYNTVIKTDTKDNTHFKDKIFKVGKVSFKVGIHHKLKIWNSSSEYNESNTHTYEIFITGINFDGYDSTGGWEFKDGMARKRGGKNYLPISCKGDIRNALTEAINDGIRGLLENKG